MNSRISRRSLVGLRTLGALVLTATMGLMSPQAAVSQDLNASERQRLAYEVRPATVLIYFNVDAEITLPGTEGPVTLQTSMSGGGSGWIVTPDGFIVTNGHVVETHHHYDSELIKKELLFKALTEAGHFTQLGNDRGQALSEAEMLQVNDELYEAATIAAISQLKAITQNGETYDASIRSYSGPIQPIAGNASVTGRLAFSSGKDVAILKVPGTDLPTLELGEGERVRVGEQVFVAGFPGAVLNASNLGQQRQLEASVLPGQIAAVRVSVEGSDLLQLDAQIGGGNSGGPVVDGTGAVLGIATMVASDQRMAASFGFAVPAATIRDFIRAEGIVTSESMFDRTWDRALDAYYGASYADAVPAFDEVLRVMPDLPDALELRRESMVRRDDPDAPRPEPSVDPGALDATPTPVPVQPAAEGGMPGWLLPVLALGVLLIGGGLMMRRSPAPATAGAPAQRSAAAAATVVQPAPPAAKTATLVVTEGALKGNRFEVESGGLTIGRDPSVCQIVLSEASVSREHAVIRPNGTSWVIKNLSGTNPTYVNDRAIQETGLKKGDKVKVGDSVFTMEVA